MTECDKSARKNRYDALSNELENVKKAKKSDGVQTINVSARNKL